MYEIAVGSIDLRRPLHAAVLSSGGWASHFSAAELLRFIDARPRPPQIVIANGRCVLSLDAVVHRSRYMTAAERTTVDGIACTAPARTLLDLASVASEAALDDAIGRAVGSGRVTMRRIDTYLGKVIGGRPGARALRAAMERHRDRSGVTQTLLEVLVLRAVETGALPPPDRQHVVRVEPDTYHLDLAWPRAKVFIEADGFAYHRSRREFLQDRVRQNALVVAGWLPLRYTWPAATGDPAVIVRQVRSVLASRVTTT